MQSDDGANPGMLWVELRCGAVGEAGRGTFASPEMRRTLLRWIGLAGAGMSFSDDHPETETSPRPWYAALRANSARALRAVADTVIPPVCLACSAPVLGADALCPRCWRQMSFIRAPLCDRLGLPMPFGGQAGGGPLISAAAAASPPEYDRARAVAVFNTDESGTVLRDLVHGLKYADRHEARCLLGRWLVEAGRELLPVTDLIIPVPLTRWRLMRRQFNQAAMLAREVSRAAGIPTDPLVLFKTKTTPTQVGLTREQRRLNVRGAFAVSEKRREAIEGKNLLLIDDVITTGATVEACARALKRAGGARVDVLALGLVTRPIVVTV